MCLDFTYILYYNIANNTVVFATERRNFMEKFIPVLRDTRLFAGVASDEIDHMLGCLRARVKTFSRGEYVFRRGDEAGAVCVLISGELHVQNDDYWGNRSITGRVEVGELFGEAHATECGGTVMSDVVAQKDSTVMFFDVRKMLTVCTSACRFHTAVVQNLFFSVSEKNLGLEKKLDHLSRRTTREKLISYISEEARLSNSSSFSIPYNRQQLADYLSVDRSAMSNELCKMRDEGLLIFEKNRFTLLEH